MKKVDEHKHLGIVLDKKLSFSAHIKEAISKTRKGIGMLKFSPVICPGIPLMNYTNSMCNPI